MSPEELQRCINQLYWWDGYEREAALKQLKGCFEPDLFPHLLRKLSDYVPINRQLAAQHLLVWSERPECIDICIDYFLDVYAIQERIRIVGEIDDILMGKIAQNLDKVKPVLRFKQGKLSRTLYRYLLDKKILSELELVGIAQYAKDQGIRKYWILFVVKQDVAFIKQQLMQTQYADVKKAILYELQQQGELNEVILLQALNSQYLSIIDIAIYELKQRDFDFFEYFRRLLIGLALTEQEVRLGLMQMLLLKWDKQDFYSLIKFLNQPSVLFVVLYKAMKLEYFDLDEVVKVLEEKQLRLPFYLLRKFILLDRIQPRQLDHLYQFSNEQLGIAQRLEAYDHFSFWNRFDWLICLWKYCHTHIEKQILKEKVEVLLSEVKHQYYRPIWTKEDRLKRAALFATFCQIYSLTEQYMQECKRIQELLI
ncbi:hypothetical protein MMP66_17810 [Acinetobacter dispersus]|uniref:hypothetical protein n=1 Tax=Acinetobacter dispersus TaxID=70348 RepID=UPI001F4AD048|nr:hypothetical protein [Acinetobacter dispersus]MCH7396106.1 hypothetical protein [Acinetobacter dispersus]